MAPGPTPLGVHILKILSKMYLGLFESIINLYLLIQWARPSNLHSLKFYLQCTSDWRVLDLHLLLKWFAATICNCGLLSSSHYRLLVPTIDNVIPLIVVSLAKVTAGARLYLRATAPRKYTQHTYSVVLSTPAHHCCTGRIS